MNTIFWFASFCWLWESIPSFGIIPGAFGLLTQDFPLVHLSFQVHPTQPSPSKALVTWLEPNANSVYPLGPVPVPQALEKMDVRQQSLSVLYREQSGPLASLSEKGKDLKELRLKKKVELKKATQHPLTGHGGDQMVLESLCSNSQLRHLKFSNWFPLIESQ